MRIAGAARTCPSAAHHSLQPGGTYSSEYSSSVNVGCTP